jgi:hypothetical protein
MVNSTLAVAEPATEHRSAARADQFVGREIWNRRPACGRERVRWETATEDCSWLCESEPAILTKAVLASGFTEHEIRLVMGENVKRFLLANLPGT